MLLPLSYSSYNWKFICFDHIYPFPHIPPPPSLQNTNLFSVSMTFFPPPQFPRLSEIINYIYEEEKNPASKAQKEML